GTVTFKYDPFGRRIQRTSPSGITNYIYDGNNILEELDSTGNAVLVKYTQGEWVDEPLAMRRLAQSFFYEADGVGSITSISDSTPSIAASYGYDSFGITRTSAGSVATSFRYAARELDVETGLYYYRARYYDSNTGRFLSEDPRRSELNFFRYSGNSPTNFIDPFGLFWAPPSPKWLPPGWEKDPTHLDPNGERWRHPSGDYLDF